MMKSKQRSYYNKICSQRKCLSVEEVYVQHKESYTKNPLIQIITYIDATRQNLKKPLAEQCIQQTTGIIYESAAGYIRFADFTNPQCKQEYIDKIEKEFTGEIPFHVWCGFNGIPYRRFHTKKMNRQVIRVEGEVIKHKKPDIKTYKNPAWKGKKHK